MIKINRKDFLISAGSAMAGGVAAILGRRVIRRPPPGAEDVKESFSQSGEDRIVDFTCRSLNIWDISYLDVGAFHPTRISNTYLFYKMGFRGVLVEPNVTMCEQLRAVRPKDKTLAAGIGVTSDREADYYVMTDASWNTFSKEEAERGVEASKGAITIAKVIKMPLLNINDVMAEHCKGAPIFLNVDAEGLDLAILKTIDFKRFRPKIICAETVVCGTQRTVLEIPEFMATQGYVVRGQTLPNTLFVDSALLG